MKEKQNLWTQKKNIIILCIAAVMVVVFALSFVSFFKTEEETAEEYKPYDNMYNASRYFFRVFYPDDWDVNAEPYGFLMDEEGLVLELFPLKKIASTPGASAGLSPTKAPATISGSAPTLDPKAGMERNNDLTIKFYYKEYDEIPLTNEENVSVATSTPAATSPIPTASASSATPQKENEAPIKLIDLAEILFEDFKTKHKDMGYTFTAERTQKGQTVDFCVLPYSYIKDDIKMSGEMYVASRGMAYYVIFVDGTASAFTRYYKTLDNIIYNLKFSVFDY